MAWTTPRTWVAGELVTATMLNAQVRDNENFIWSEGTWTPTIGSTGGAASGATYSQQVGSWVKVGRLVMATGRMVLSAKGTIPAGQLVIMGLPFTGMTTATSSAGAVIVPYFASLATTWVDMSGIVAQATTWMLLFGMQSAAAGKSIIAGTDVSNTSDFIVQASYLTP